MSIVRINGKSYLEIEQVKDEVCMACGTSFLFRINGNRKRIIKRFKMYYRYVGYNFECFSHDECINDVVAEHFKNGKLVIHGNTIDNIELRGTDSKKLNKKNYLDKAEKIFVRILVNIFADKIKYMYEKYLPFDIKFDEAYRDKFNKEVREANRISLENGNPIIPYNSSYYVWILNARKN